MLGSGFEIINKTQGWPPEDYSLVRESDSRSKILHDLRTYNFQEAAMISLSIQE